MTAAPHPGAHKGRDSSEIINLKNNQLKSSQDVALHFHENTTPHQTKSMTYTTSTRANCRRWVKKPTATVAGNAILIQIWVCVRQSGYFQEQSGEIIIPVQFATPTLPALLF